MSEQNPEGANDDQQAGTHVEVNADEADVTVQPGQPEPDPDEGDGDEQDDGDDGDTSD